MLNKYEWNKAVEKAYINKALTPSALSKTAKELYELSFKADPYVKGCLRSRLFQYSEIFINENHTATFSHAELLVNGVAVGCDYQKLFVF